MPRATPIFSQHLQQLDEQKAGVICQAVSSGMSFKRGGQARLIALESALAGVARAYLEAANEYYDDPQKYADDYLAGNYEKGFEKGLAHDVIDKAYNRYKRTYLREED